MKVYKNKIFSSKSMANVDNNCLEALRGNALSFRCRLQVYILTFQAGPI
jgi:hypothetical protein